MTLTDGNFEEEVMNSDDIWFVEVGGCGFRIFRGLRKLMRPDGWLAGWLADWLAGVSWQRTSVCLYKGCSPTLWWCSLVALMCVAALAQLA